MLQKYNIINILDTNDAFICGPESMISEVSHGFRLEGLASQQIHYELFANSSADSNIMLEKSKLRVKHYGEEETSKVTVISDGRSINFDLAVVTSLSKLGSCFSVCNLILIQLKKYEDKKWSHRTPRSKNSVPDNLGK